jgi:uncharacterized protein (TIGR03382 family)
MYSCFRPGTNDRPRDDLRLAERSSAAGVFAAVLSMLTLLGLVIASQVSESEVVRIVAVGVPFTLAAAAAVWAAISRRRLASLRARGPSLASVPRTGSRRARSGDGAAEDDLPFERKDVPCTSSRQTS